MLLTMMSKPPSQYSDALDGKTTNKTHATAPSVDAKTSPRRR